MSNRLRDHEVDFKFKKNYGIGLPFTDIDGDECISIAPKGKRVVYLYITSWAGVCPGAEHYYGRLEFGGLSHKKIKTGEIKHTGGYGDDLKPKEMHGFIIELTRKLRKDFSKSSLTGSDFTYEAGDDVSFFDSEESVKAKAQKEFKRIFGPGWIMEIQ